MMEHIEAHIEKVTLEQARQAQELTYVQRRVEHLGNLNGQVKKLIVVVGETEDEGVRGQLNKFHADAMEKLDGVTTFKRLTWALIALIGTLILFVGTLAVVVAERT